MILVGKELTDYLFLLFIIYIIYSTINSHRKYFLPRVEIKYCNIEIDRRNFYDQPINDLIKQDDEVRRRSKKNISRTRWWLHNWLFIGFFAYFKNNCRLIAADLSQQKVLDADSRAI